MEKLLNKVDLNLLRILYALLEERSVTRAAERLSITQSTMSKSLLRLRELLDDPLFVRSPHGLLPTPRAQEFVEPLQRIFDELGTYLTTHEFNPACAHGQIQIAAPEQFAVLAIPRLFLRLRSLAPHLGLGSQHLMDDYLEHLMTGKLDFAITLEQEYPEGYDARVIYSATPMVWFRKKHPLAAKDTIGIDDMCAYPAITFRMQNVPASIMRRIETMFSEAGRRLNVLFDTSHLMVALETIVNSDALMPAPDYLCHSSLLHDAVISRSISHLPVFKRHHINMSLVQHKRTAQSPLHRWVEKQMTEMLAH